MLRSLNLLLIFVPLTWVLAFAAPDSIWVFLSAAVSLIPLAGLIGSATDELAERSGPTLGGFLNATFGNAAEHYSAISAARDDEMTLAVEIAVGSSAQVALLVAPVPVLASFGFSHPMSLLFNPFEIVAVVLSVMAVMITVMDGESNWVEGLQLLIVYVIMAVAFFLIPAGRA